MRKLILTFWILILVVWPVSLNAAENQKIIFSGSYSLNNENDDADSAWLYMFYYGTKIDSAKVTAEDLQWDGYYQHTHQCTNDSADGWTGVWIFFDTYSNSTISVNDPATVASARDSSYALETSVTAVRDSMDEAAQIADTTGTAESVADQVWREDLSGHNIYGGAAVNILGLAPIQALALAPGSHEQTTTRITLNLTATTNDLFNGCLIAARSGNNEGFTTRITDYEAYSGDSGVVIVSPPLVLAATENQLFVITGAAHWGDTVQTQLASEAQVDSLFDTLHVLMHASDTAGLPASIYAEFTDGTNEDAFKYGGVTGEYQLTIVAYDSSSNVVLMDCPITIRNEAQHSQRWEFSTLSTGEVVFSLDSGSYTAYGSGTREMSEIDTVLVEDDMLDTVFFWTRIVEISGDPDLCTVFGSIMSPKGEALEGVTLTFSLPGISSDTAVGKMLSTEVVTTWTDQNGDFSVDLLKTENLIPAGKRWHLSIWHEDYFEFMRWTADFPVPADSSQLDISKLTADMIGHSVR